MLVKIIPQETVDCSHCGGNTMCTKGHVGRLHGSNMPVNFPDKYSCTTCLTNAGLNEEQFNWHKYPPTVICSVCVGKGKVAIK